ncbi:MAG TPA: hypothetical protein PLG66_21275 [Calditrichia bacterium]|nr:hypothetical protein [Calditrichia bacterium]
MEQQLHILEEMEGLTCEKVRLGSESVFRLTLERDGEVRVYTLTVTRGIRLNLESRRKAGVVPRFCD